MQMRGAVRAAVAAVTVLLLMSLAVLSAPAERAPRDVQVKKNPVALSDGILAKSKAAYQENCVQCHGASGKGDGPMAGMLKERPADLTNPRTLVGMTDGELYWIMTKGEDPMPAFDGKLTDEERWAMVHLMRNMSNTKPNNTPRKAN
jgi:mono/diheme cytochrome c family protein